MTEAVAVMLFPQGDVFMMIVGQKILDDGLVTGGSVDNLKHSTYDLTVGEIIPIGKRAVKERQKEPSKTYYLEPREMVWVLSKEEFNLPKDVTGLATLRTTFTKDGILALNVGIIDPLFHGPISTALINFSDRPRRIDVGDKFFRVIFFRHDDTTAFHHVSESTERHTYTRSLETISYSDFSRSFLNIPSFDDKFYQEKFWNILWYGCTKNWTIAGPLALFAALVFWFLIDKGFIDFLFAKLSYLKNIRNSLSI
jgi:deoxycytidine triphosphate deaminase